MDMPVTLPASGELIEGSAPIVIIGPNGSGKTRQSRAIGSESTINFVNALRNTRIPVELPAMGIDSARSNYDSQLGNARSNPSELYNEFDFMLSKLLAQHSTAAIEFTRRYQNDSQNPGSPRITPLSRVEEIWGQVFPGRSLEWNDWKPLVRNATSGSRVEYSGNGMSDGEKAALYLAGRVFDAPPGVLVVDEPETHLHTLLASRLWNTLEDEREDIRFIYVTHDLNFALSRRNATYVLASPTAGLKTIELASTVPDDVAEALIGSASLSFYASRVVFCEGEESSLDGELYRAWFNGQDTVVRSVGSCERVLRCVDTLASSGITNSLEATGLIDRDHHPIRFIDSLPNSVQALPVHEIESLFSLPEIVRAIARHNASDFDESAYLDAIAKSVSEEQVQNIIVDRWKARIEPLLGALVASVDRTDSSAVKSAIPQIFDPTKWSFDPADFLDEETASVTTALASRDAASLLRVVPGKQILSIAARAAGTTHSTYIRQVTRSLSGVDPALVSLGAEVASALTPYLPSRHVAAAIPAAPV